MEELKIVDMSVGDKPGWLKPTLIITAENGDTLQVPLNRSQAEWLKNHTEIATQG